MHGFMNVNLQGANGPLFGGSYEGHKLNLSPECIGFLNVEPGNIKLPLDFKGTSQVTCSMFVVSILYSVRVRNALVI